MMRNRTEGRRLPWHPVRAGAWTGILALATAACGGSDDSNPNDTSSGGTAAGGALTGGVGATGIGGAATGGSELGGSTTGGVATGGTPTGGSGTGGIPTGGVGVGGATGGTPTGGTAAGGSATGGGGVGGSATGGAGAGGAATGGAASGGVGAGGSATGGTGAGGTGGSDVCAADSSLAGEFPECFALELSNGIDATRTDAAVFVGTSDILAAHPNFNPNAFVVLDGSTELASQAVDQEPDGTADEIVILANLAPSESRTLAVRYATSGTNVRTYPQRAQALVSPKTGGSWSGDTYVGGEYEDVDFLDLTGHIDHDANYMRFEGPGWESDRVGHRIYADRRNGGDIFGKKLPEMVLHAIDYTNEDYSTMQNWGMDILHVGDALGVGSPGTWQNGTATKLANVQSLTIQIVASGPVYAHLRMSHGGWQTGAGTYDVTTDISITAGSRATRFNVNVSGGIANVCAGMPRHDQASVVTPSVVGGWTYLATHGNQSLVPDALGIAILYRAADEQQVVEDSVNRLAVLTPAAGQVTYYLVADWVQEQAGSANQQEFAGALEATLRELDSPITVTVL